MPNAEEKILAILAEKEEVKITVSKHQMDLLRKGLSLTQPGVTAEKYIADFIRREAFSVIAAMATSLLKRGESNAN